MKKIAIIVAGGHGTRMGSKEPKQFLLLHHKPVLWYTITTFLSSFSDMEIVLVLPKDFLEFGQHLIATAFPEKLIYIVEGGETRFHSVKNGLKRVIEPSIIFVHDGVRCLVTETLIKRCYEQALEKGSAIPCIGESDSVRIMEGEKHRVIAREAVKKIQTPQTFKSAILLPAFESEYQEGFTDEATVVELHGTPVDLIEGEFENIKITRPQDLIIAEGILGKRLFL